MLGAAIIVLAGLAAYSNSLSGPFVLDDVGSIVDNPTIRHLGAWPGAFAPPGGSGLTVEGRPMLNLSLALNHAISGTNVGSYHALNLLIHLLAGLILFGVVRRTLLRWSALSPTRLLANGVAKRVGDPPSPGFGGLRNALDPTLIAFAIALLWTVHPLQTESVTYVVQRAESLMGLFYLLTVYGFIRSVERVAESAEAPAKADPQRAGSAGDVAQRGCRDHALHLVQRRPSLVFTLLSPPAFSAWRRKRSWFRPLWSCCSTIELSSPAPSARLGAGGAGTMSRSPPPGCSWPGLSGMPATVPERWRRAVE